VQPATPVPDVRGPSATEQARTLLRQMQAGRVDRAQLGEEFSWWLTDAKVTAAAPRLAALGEPTAVDQEARVERGGMEVTVTKFTFASTAINALMYRSPDGLVQQYLLLRR
jgi:D-alanyl-D-alanine carboxypeptidase